MGCKQHICCCLFIIAGIVVRSHAHATSGISVQRSEVHWSKKGAAGKCRAGRHGLKCSQCPKGYYSTDGIHCQRCTNSKTTGDCENGCTSPSQCTEVGCPVGTYKTSSSSDCEPCPVGQYSEGGYPFPRSCEHCPAGTTTPGRGSYSPDQCVQKVCPAGTARHPSGVQCVPCAIGTYSAEGAEVCTLCGQGMTTLEEGASDFTQCICEVGMEPSGEEDGNCAKCKAGTFKPHNGNQACDACPWPKITLKPGSASPAACVCPVGSGSGPDCDECPDNMVLLEDGTCGCPAGNGGPNCEECKANTYSIGGLPGNPWPRCKPCGLHFTSPPGSISAEWCECAAGYGADSEDDRRCVSCQLGTFNPGTKTLRGGAAKVASTGMLSAAQVAIAAIPAKKQRFADKPLASPCQRCGAAHMNGMFTTLQTGSTSAESCACMPGFGGSSCSACPAGTYSEGGPHAVCRSCPARGAGYTTNPVSAATSMAACVCLPGYGVSEGGVCRLCPVNTYSEGGTKEECQPCPFGSTSAPGSTDLDSCVMVAQECPIGQTAPVEAVSLDQCGCLPGYGGGKTPQDACSICPVGTFAPGGDTQACQPCKFGFTSPAGSTSEEQCYRVAHACPAGTQAPKGREIASIDECVCQAGHGISSTSPASSSSGRTCSLCPEGTYSKGGRLRECRPCPFGTSSPIGAMKLEECEYSPQACPIGQWAPEGAMTKDQCICYPGFGGGETNTDPCTICPAGTYSLGKTIDKCIPCDFGMTSPVGSTSRDACYPAKHCPAGTRVPPSKYRPGYASSKGECKCKPGYGSTTGEGVCKLCPVSTYAPGGNMEDCKPCRFGTTSAAGSTDRSDCRPEAQKCPVGQIAPWDAVSADECCCLPGYGGGATSSDACQICPAGSWSPGGSRQPCTPCGFGYSSPEGSTSEEACYTTNACPSGTEPHRAIETPSGLQDCVCKKGYGSPTGAGICRTCPAGTYGPGGNMEECKACPFGTTSAEGSTSRSQCKFVPQACTIGQWAPLDAVSKEECRCYKGHGGGQDPSDPCHICPVGTFSANKGTAACVPCRFGFTSPEGAEDEGDCYPIDSCPAGTVIPGHTAGASAQECRCKPGHGSPTGSGPCHLCPVGTFSPGGTMDDCQPCPFGTTSKAGADSSFECVPVAQKCPPGQIAAPDAESREQCGCLPGYGGGETPYSACHICPAGSWSPGGSTQPCIPCGFGYSSTEGATSGSACLPVNSCPAGTDYRQHDPEMAFTQADCVCKPGFGSPTGSGICRLCPSGTFSEGGSMEDCRPCAFGMTSSDGAERCTRAIEQGCPIGQWAPANAVSKDACRCYKGFGGGNHPSDACHICPAGSYSANKGTERCVSCPFGYTSPEGSHSDEQCFAMDLCPAGTGVPPGQHMYNIAQCKCRPGFGSTTDSAPCHLCPVGTFSMGGSMESCMPCPFGTTSEAGARGIDDCVASAQPCPVGQVAPPGAVSSEECGCLPGFGSGDKPSDACHICPAGSWSPGGHTQPCKPCGFGYTGPEGASSHEQCHAMNACPAGTIIRTEGHQGSGPWDCVCQPGHGTVMGSGPCKLCPAGTFARGGTLEECIPCGFGFTSAEGSDSRQACRPVSQACPLGQWAAADAVSPEECRCYRGFGGGASREEPCTMCPAGTFSANSGTERCNLCPPGTTSLEGAGDEAECFPSDWDCPAGTARLYGPKGRPSRTCKCKAGYGSATGSAPCRLCPVGSFSEGRTMEDCSPCPFGFTSRAGARSDNECVRESQPCPIGQIAPPHADSADQCFCLPGYEGGATPKDPCRVCQPGSWSPGGSTQPCIACGFGYTSVEGAWSDKQCVATNACPAGTEYRAALDAVFSISDCVCQPGHGSATGTGICRLCTAGTYSHGGTMEQCMTCPDGMASREGARSDRNCREAYPRGPHEEEALALMGQKGIKEGMQQQHKVQPQQQQQKASGDAALFSDTLEDAKATMTASTQTATTAKDDHAPAPKLQQPAAAPAGQGPQQLQQKQQQQLRTDPAAAGQTVQHPTPTGSQASKQEQQKVQTPDNKQQQQPTAAADASHGMKQQQAPVAAAKTQQLPSAGNQARKGYGHANAAGQKAPQQQQQGVAAQAPLPQQQGAATAQAPQVQQQGQQQQQQTAADQPIQQGTAAVGPAGSQQVLPSDAKPTQRKQTQRNSTQHSTADAKAPGATAATGSSPQHDTAGPRPAQKADGSKIDQEQRHSNTTVDVTLPQAHQKPAGDAAAAKQQVGQTLRSSSGQQQLAAASNGSATAPTGMSPTSGSQSSSNSTSQANAAVSPAAGIPAHKGTSGAVLGAQANSNSNRTAITSMQASSSSGAAPDTKQSSGSSLSQATEAAAHHARIQGLQESDASAGNAQELSNWEQEAAVEQQLEQVEEGEL